MGLVASSVLGSTRPKSRWLPGLVLFLEVLENLLRNSFRLLAKLAFFGYWTVVPISLLAIS